jgi:hypothetical protein
VNDDVQKEAIKRALVASTTNSEASLRQIAAGSTKAELINLFKEDLDMSRWCASVLAGILVAPAGKFYFNPIISPPHLFN